MLRVNSRYRSFVEAFKLMDTISTKPARRGAVSLCQIREPICVDSDRGIPLGFAVGGNLKQDIQSFGRLAISTKDNFLVGVQLVGAQSLHDLFKRWLVLQPEGITATYAIAVLTETEGTGTRATVCYI